MKKLINLIAIVFAFNSVGQEITFSEVAFKSWSKSERQEKLFGLFEETPPTDEKLSELISKLVESGDLDINIRSKNKKISLFDACIEHGMYASAMKVLESGYKINQRCFECQGETPLHIVVKKSGNLEESSSELTELLYYMLTNEADPDLRDMKALTPLHYVIKNKDKAAFEVFLKEDVTFNQQLGTLKGLGYLQFFDKHWNEDECRTMLMEKTELTYPPTKQEIKDKEKATKEKEKEKKESAKAEKKAGKKDKKSKD